MENIVMLVVRSETAVAVGVFEDGGRVPAELVAERVVFVRGIVVAAHRVYVRDERRAGRGMTASYVRLVASE